MKKNDIKLSKKDIIFILNYCNSNFLWILDNNLKNDKDISLLLVKKNSNNFLTLWDELKQDVELWKLAIESMIRERVNIKLVVEFIDKYFKGNDLKDTLLDHYSYTLYKEDKVLKDDLSVWTIFIMNNDTSFYKVLLEKNILEVGSSKITLKKSFISEIISQFSKNWDLKSLEGDKLIEAKKEILSNFLWVSFNELPTPDLFVYDSIFNLVSSWENQNNLDLLYQKEWKNNPIKDELYDTEIEPEEKLDYSLWEYKYHELPSWYYSISTSSNKNIEISKKELDLFTSAWLKNFVEFYEMLYLLGLNFLWDKNKSSFLNILNNKIDFNYPDPDWVNESKSLRFLNLILRSIWFISIKDDSENSNDSDTWVIHKNFDNLDWAKHALSEIKSTWKIWNEVYDTSSTSIFEKILKNREYIDKDNQLVFTKFLET